jgi:hypothetical protein
MRELLTKLFGRVKPTEAAVKPPEVLGEPAGGPHDSAPPKDYFTHIYAHNCWEGKESRSGEGSEGDFAKQKVSLITELIKDFGVRSILDLGCGDFHWMPEVVRSIDRYHGVDVVESLIQENKRRFENRVVSFQCLDLSDPEEQRVLSLRDADLVTCLDVFGHLLNKEVDSLLNFIFYEIQAKLFLVTNRRDATSGNYLKHEKSRHEGIDLEIHPSFMKRRPLRVKQLAGLYPNDFFDLYDLSGHQASG